MKTQLATFAAGCFWGIEEAFRKLKGVVSTTAGYTGGSVENPSYEQVCSHATGHAEAVLVEFDPKKISYEKLLGIFWKIHDPTQKDRQGPDVGKQYRSTIFYHDQAQKKAAIKSKAAEQKNYGRSIATEIVKVGKFWRGEEYHQKYLQKRGLKVC